MKQTNLYTSRCCIDGVLGLYQVPALVEYVTTREPSNLQGERDRRERFIDKKYKGQDEGLVANCSELQMLVSFLTPDRDFRLQRNSGHY